jgi:Stage II sporulation protein E (SpoIIE)
MASARWMRVRMALCGWLTGACAALLLAMGCASAYASAVPALGAYASAVPALGAYASAVPALSAYASAVPALSVSLPEVKVPVPGVNVTVPEVSVSVPEVHVTVPEVKVTAPGVGVSVPEVGLSTPEVSVSTPSVSVSGSGAQGTPPAEAPAGGGAGEGHAESPSGGGSPVSPSGPGSSSGGQPGGSGSAGASGSPTAHAASASVAAASTPTSHTPVGGAGGRSHHGSSHAGRGASRARGGKRDRGGAGAGGHGSASVVAAADTRAHGGATRASATSRAGSAFASNPLEAIGKHIPSPIPVPDWSKPIILALLALALWFGVRSRTAARRARRLERQRATLLRDVGAMQAALVPEIPARVAGLAVSVAYRPAEGPAAGGDFYDVLSPERGKVAIILGDVAGHGHRALTRAALTRYTLRAYLQAGLEPRAALALTGRVLADPSAEQFATVLVAIYNTRDCCLTFASAGHPPPIIQGLRTREPVSSCASPPVGWTAPTGRRQTTVSLPRGAVVCMFSDGLIEARCERDLLGRERLAELLAGLGPKPDAGKLLARVREAAVATPDDMAACVLTPEMALVGTETHVEELEVDTHALGGDQARRFLQACELRAADIERAIARASDVAAVFGAALLRVELAAGSAAATTTVTALAPSQAGNETPDRPRRPSGLAGVTDVQT